MWESFTRGPYGVLIRTTVGNLKTSFDVTGYTVYLNRVTYHDVPPVDPSPVHQALAMKSSAFSYQNEMRVVSKEGWHKLLSMSLGHKGHQVAAAADASIFTNAFGVELRMIDVAVQELVREVILSPHSDDALLGLVQGLLEQAAMGNVPVSASAFRNLFRHSP